MTEHTSQARRGAAPGTARHPRAAGEPVRVSSKRPVFGADRWLLRKALSALGDPPVRFVLWNGEEIASARAETPLARIHIPERGRLLTLFLYPYHFFGDGYARGEIELEGELVEAISALYDAMDRGRGGFLGERVPRWLSRPKRNTLAGSRRNIHHHYDISNDFYRLWLDERMVYTCAYFPTPESTLEAAQLAKMDHVCRKLRLEPGQSVVEAGCGWGSLALHMAERYGVRVRAFNISSEQIAFARERARALGLQDRVEFVEDDYRSISGQYDAFVSVGMLEHVGPENYRALGDLIHRTLRPGGLGLVHNIARNRAQPMNPWIEERIFPGSYPPSLKQMMRIFEPHEFSVLDVENLRLHYAKTCEHWLARFEQSAERVAQMFDEEFVRTWRIYLAGSVAAFLTGSLQLFQVVFAHPRNNRIPWTREDLYAKSRRPRGSARPRRPRREPARSKQGARGEPASGRPASARDG